MMHNLPQEMNWENLSTEKKKFISKYLLVQRILWFVFTLIFLLINKSYKRFFIIFLATIFFSWISQITWFYFILYIFLLVRSIFIFIKRPEIAFNNSADLKQLVIKRKWEDVIKPIILNHDKVNTHTEIEWNKVLIKKNIKIWDTIIISNKWNPWYFGWENWDLVYIITNIK